MAKPYYTATLRDFNKKYTADLVCEVLGAWMQKKKMVEFIEETGDGYCQISNFDVFYGVGFRVSPTHIMSFWKEEMAQDFIRDISTLKSVEKISYAVKPNQPDFMRRFTVEKTEWNCTSMHLMEIILESGEDPIKVLEEVESRLGAKKLGLI